MGLKAVHFGAGNIGRGFVGWLLYESGYEVVFADVQESIIKQLQEQKNYKVIQVGTDETKDSIVTNYRAINSKTNEDDVVKEIATADVVTCSVGPNILKFIAPVIAKGIDQRPSGSTPLAVIACENAIGATDTLAGYIKAPENTPPERLADHDTRARYANSAIDRIVPAQDVDAGLDVKLEHFYEWVVDATPFKEFGPPPIKGIKWVDDLIPFIERKLYTVNTGHAAAAYFGYGDDKHTVHEALQSKVIEAKVRKALEETSALIVAKHGISEEEQKEYVEKIIKRISNPHLKDSVRRVGRAPVRKLSGHERFIGPAAELAEKGQAYAALLEAAEAAFRFQKVQGDDESTQLARIIEHNSPEDVVKEVCQLEPSHPLFPKVVDIVRRLQTEQKKS